MATGESTHHDNAGRSVEVDLTSTVAAHQVAYVDGWLGITAAAGDSGNSIALITDRQAYQFTVPAALSVSKGDTVYIDTTDLTGHLPDESGYATSSGANLVALFKAIEDKDANDNVIGILLPEGV